MDDRDQQQGRHSGSRTHDRPPRSFGGSDHRDFGQAQQSGRRGGPGSSSFERHGIGRRNEDFRGHEQDTRGDVHFQHNDRGQQNSNAVGNGNWRSFNDGRRRSRSRSNERLDRRRSPNSHRNGNGSAPDRNGRPNRAEFEERRPLDNQQSFEGRDRQEERRQKYQRMAPSQEDLSKIPPYINPRAVNINKVIEQQEKRKLLWQGSKSKADPQAEAAPDQPAGTKAASTSVWKNVTFSGDNDGSMANKFKKLMGLKKADGEAPPSTSTTTGEEGTSGSSQPNSKQDDLFRNLDRQYEMARLSAHTQKGLGLGFSSR